VVNPSGGLEVSPYPHTFRIGRFIPPRRRVTPSAQQGLGCTFTSPCSYGGVSTRNPSSARNLTRVVKGLVQCKFLGQRRSSDWFTTSGSVVL